MALDRPATFIAQVNNCQTLSRWFSPDEWVVPDWSGPDRVPYQVNVGRGTTHTSIDHLLPVGGDGEVEPARGAIAITFPRERDCLLPITCTVVVATWIRKNFVWTYLKTWFVHTITDCWFESWPSRTCSTTCTQMKSFCRRCIRTSRIQDRSCSDWVTERRRQEPCESTGVFGRLITRGSVWMAKFQLG